MKNNKKGFTIVELVIVIAVIAILAAVLIPTFSGVVEKARISKALQEAKNALTNDLALLDGDALNYEDGYFLTEDTTGVEGKTYYTRTGTTPGTYTYAIGSFSTESYEKWETAGTFSEITDNGYTYTYDKSDYTAIFENGEWDVEIASED